MTFLQVSGLNKGVVCHHDDGPGGDQSVVVVVVVVIVGVRVLVLAHDKAVSAVSRLFSSLERSFASATHCAGGGGRQGGCKRCHNTASTTSKGH